MRARGPGREEKSKTGEEQLGGVRPEFLCFSNLSVVRLRRQVETQLGNLVRNTNGHCQLNQNFHKNLHKLILELSIKVSD